MLADRLGRCATGSGAKPCTLQPPQTSRQIFRLKRIVVGPFAQCRTPCDRTSAKRSIRMPTAIPIRTRNTPATSSAERQVPCCLSPRVARLTGLGTFDSRPTPLLPKSKRAMAEIPILHPVWCAPNKERSANKFSSRNMCPLHKEHVKGDEEQLMREQLCGRAAAVPFCAEMSLGSGFRSGEQSNAGAISCHSTQLRNSQKRTRLFGLRSTRSEYRLRRKAGHKRTANPVTPVALSSTSIGLAATIRFREASKWPPINSS